MIFLLQHEMIKLIFSQILFLGRSIITNRESNVCDIINFVICGEGFSQHYLEIVLLF